MYNLCLYTFRLMTILGCILLSMVATSLAELSTIPTYEPDISEYVWFESHISDYIQDDKEEKVTTVSNTGVILDTYKETLQDIKKTLKLQMRLG